MANLVKRENDTNREVARSSGGHRLDPFRMMNALLRWDPFRDDLGSVTSLGVEFAPRFDVKETKDAYVLKADLPGVKEDDLEVSLSGNMLTISGKKDEEHEEEGEQYYAMERSHGSFARSFTLPDSTDGEHVTADLKNGVLTVQIPKRPEAQARKIRIGTASATEGAVKA
jgi:HSP20 family protein